MRPPLAGVAIVSTLRHALSVLRTSGKSPLTGPSTRVNHCMMIKSSSFSATEPISAPELAGPTRRTRPDRSCGSRDTTLSHTRSQRRAHGGGRHTGWVSVGRRMSRRSRPFADMVGARAGRQRPLGAHVSQAGGHLGCAERHTSDVVRQAAHIILTATMVEGRPVRVQSECGQEAHQVAGRADDLPSIIGSGRVRRGARSEKADESVL